MKTAVEVAPDGGDALLLIDELQPDGRDRLQQFLLGGDGVLLLGGVVAVGGAQGEGSARDEQIGAGDEDIGEGVPPSCRGRC